MRLVVSLDLPLGLRQVLGDIQDDLGVGRMVPDENLHLTLTFLDDQPPQLAERLHAYLSAIRAPAVRLSISGVEVFGGNHPAALVALIQNTPELILLHDKVAQAARMAGIDLPRRRFKPHVTLVRFPRRMPDYAPHRIAAWLSLHGDLQAVGDVAAQFSLIRSTLHQDGPLYETLASYPLVP